MYLSLRDKRQLKLMYERTLNESEESEMASQNVSWFIKAVSDNLGHIPGIDFNKIAERSFEKLSKNPNNVNEVNKFAKGFTSVVHDLGSALKTIETHLRKVSTDTSLTNSIAADIFIAICEKVAPEKEDEGKTSASIKSRAKKIRSKVDFETFYTEAFSEEKNISPEGEGRGQTVKSDMSLTLERVKESFDSYIKRLESIYKKSLTSSIPSGFVEKLFNRMVTNDQILSLFKSCLMLNSIDDFENVVNTLKGFNVNLDEKTHTNNTQQNEKGQEQKVPPALVEPAKELSVELGIDEKKVEDVFQAMVTYLKANGKTVKGEKQLKGLAAAVLGSLK